MKRLLLAGAAAVALAGPAHAQIVVTCPTCSSQAFDVANEIWEAGNWARNLEQQILQVKYEILGWEEFVKTNIQLPSRILNDLTGGVREIQGIAQEASMLGERTHFMIEDLTHPSGFGGSLEDIPAALARENQAMAWAMNQFGLSVQRHQDLAATYSAQLATLEAQEAAGPTQAAQIANQIATIRGQQTAAEAASTNAAWQAMATAEMRRAHKEVMLEAKVAENQAAAIEGLCGSMTVITPAICSGAGGGGGAQVAAAQ